MGCRDNTFYLHPLVLPPPENPLRLERQKIVACGQLLVWAIKNIVLLFHLFSLTTRLFSFIKDKQEWQWEALSAPMILFLILFYTQTWMFYVKISKSQLSPRLWYAYLYWSRFHGAYGTILHELCGLWHIIQAHTSTACGLHISQGSITRRARISSDHTRKGRFAGRDFPFIHQRIPSACPHPSRLLAAPKMSSLSTDQGWSTIACISCDCWGKVCTRPCHKWSQMW